VRNKLVAEIGLSYMGGIYNKWQDDGLIIDDKRSLDVFAIDFNTTLPRINTFITAEWAWIKVDVPSTYTEQFGNRQQGGFIDVVQPVIKRRILGWNDATLNVAVRAEYVDWNVGSFVSTNTNIGESLWSIMPAVSFRPNHQTVIRVNYRHLQQRDILDNPPSKTGGLSIGISTYF